MRITWNINGRNITKLAVLMIIFIQPEAVYMFTCMLPQNHT